MSCVFCNRDVPTRGHHIIPKCKGGKEIVSACESCESWIHNRWTHNELRDIYNNVTTIVENEEFKNFLKWLRKQNPASVFKSQTSNNRKTKNKYT